MKKSGSSKFSFVKRVLLRPPSRQRGDSAPPSPAASSSTITMEERCDPSPKSPDSQASAAKFQSELQLLRSQIETLQISVNHMQSDNEAKERALVELAKEKEQLTIDLRRHKRTNLNLRQQLEEERAFYYKEKEQYCLEMNSVKRSKQLKGNNACDAEKDVPNEQKEIANLKNTLNQTLEANYNLSVKFLRMKNTKLSLKKQLGKMAAAHDKSTDYYRSKVEEFRKLIDSVVEEQFYKPIPPSNKKYLHLLKHNGSLLHENLTLQMTVDRLNKEIERIKILQDINDTNRRLKLIHHNDDPNKVPKSSSESKCKKCNLTKVESSRTNETKSSKSVKSLKSRSSQTPSTRSRNSALIINEKLPIGHDSHHLLKEKKPHRHKQKQTDMSECSIEVVQIEKHGNLTTSETAQSHNSKFDLMTVSNPNISNNKSDCSMMVSRKAGVPEIFASKETHSAPEIVTRSKETN